eukprot:UN03290
MHLWKWNMLNQLLMKTMLSQNQMQIFKFTFFKKIELILSNQKVKSSIYNNNNNNNSTRPTMLMYRYLSVLNIAS